MTYLLLLGNFALQKEAYLQEKTPLKLLPLNKLLHQNKVEFPTIYFSRFHRGPLAGQDEKNRVVAAVLVQVPFQQTAASL